MSHVGIGWRHGKPEVIAQGLPGVRPANTMARRHDVRSALCRGGQFGLPGPGRSGAGSVGNSPGRPAHRTSIRARHASSGDRVRMSESVPWTPLFSLGVFDTANMAHRDAAGRGVHSIRLLAPDFMSSGVEEAPVGGATAPRSAPLCRIARGVNGANDGDRPPALSV